jgi:hypothetical protein
MFKNKPGKIGGLEAPAKVLLDSQEPSHLGSTVNNEKAD